MLPDDHTPTREVLRLLRQRTNGLLKRVHGTKARWAKYTVDGALITELERRARNNGEMLCVAKRCDRMIDALRGGECLLWRLNAIDVLSEAARTLRHASAIEAQRVEAENTGSIHEHAVGNADAPKG